MIEDAQVHMEAHSVFIYCRLQKIIQMRSMMKINDDVPKLPMTYRDSPISCTVMMMVIVDVEYLPS